jgi:putative ABC transport system permease protein
MRAQDLIKFSFQSFKNRKSRVAFTVAGVAIGISVILFLISLGYGLQNTIIGRITTAEALLSLDVFSPDPVSLPLTQDSIERIGRVEGIESINPKAIVSSQITANNLTSDASINLVRQEYFTFAGLRTEEGDIFDKGSNQIVVTETIAELLNIEKGEILDTEIEITMLFQGKPEFAGDDPEITVLQDSFTVVGLLQDSEVLNEIYVHLDDIDPSYITDYDSIKVKAAGQAELELVRTELTDQGFLVSALSDLAEQANKVFGIIQIILAVFGVFSLLVAAIGLVNTMTVSLLERTNEIGIMRAIGASKADIKKLFLLESALIGFMGGVTGLLLGLLASEVVNIILNVVARTLGATTLDVFFTPLWFVVFILVSSAVVGFVSGVFPASKASKLNTLEALRYK